MITSIKSFLRLNKIQKSILRYTFFLILLVSLPGCAALHFLDYQDRSSVMAGEKALVLLKVECMINDEKYEPFSYDVPMDNVTFGLGSFETFGEPRFRLNSFLSEESRREGWTCFLLSPGVYYLTVRPPQRTDAASYDKMLTSGPRWRIDVPEKTELIYVGTISFTGEGSSLLFGGEILTNINSQNLFIKNDQISAEELLSSLFPEAQNMKTILLQKWDPGTPILLRSTPPRLSEPSPDKSY